MQFKETFMYYSYSKLWWNFSNLNAYSAVLASPVFVMMLIALLPMTIIIDAWVALRIVLSD